MLLTAALVAVLASALAAIVSHLMAKSMVKADMLTARAGAAFTVYVTAYIALLGAASAAMAMCLDLDRDIYVLMAVVVGLSMLCALGAFGLRSFNERDKARIAAERGEGAGPASTEEGQAYKAELRSRITGILGAMVIAVVVYHASGIIAGML